MIERLGEIGAGAGLGVFEPAQKPVELPLAGGRPDIVAKLIVEYNQAGGIALSLDREVKQRGCGIARVIHLADFVRSVVHRIAGIEKPSQQGIGLAAGALQVATFGTGETVPVDIAQIVPGRVGAIFSKLLAETEGRRAVQTRDESVHHGLSYKIEAGEAGEHRGIEKALFHQAPEGGGIWASSRRRISSGSIRSDSAWKLSRMR